MSDDNGNLPTTTPGSSPPTSQSNGPGWVKRLPDWIKPKGPEFKDSSHGFQQDGADETAEANAGGQLGSLSAAGKGGDATARFGYGNVSTTATGSITPDGLDASVGAKAGAGLLTVDGKTAPMAGGLADASGGGRVLAIDANYGAAVKFTRKEATLNAHLGASAVVAEVHSKGEIVLTPQRIYNGVIVNGVNLGAHWLGFKEQMKKIQNGALDHGIVLSYHAGAQFGASLGAEGHAGYQTGADGNKTASIGGSFTAAAGPGGTIGGGVGFR